GPATTMAGGIALAATWNPTLAERVGTELGRDARAKGVHFLLGPGVNIYRAPMNGRNFEYFGEDPFLASRIPVGYIKGVQSLPFSRARSPLPPLMTRCAASFGSQFNSAGSIATKQICLFRATTNKAAASHSKPRARVRCY